MAEENRVSIVLDLFTLLYSFLIKRTVSIEEIAGDRIVVILLLRTRLA